MGLSPYSQLLDRDPQKRLGWKQGGGGLKDIKNHPWFRAIDWEALERKEVPPSFVPDVRPLLPRFLVVGVSLTSLDFFLQSKKANFDATHELEELLLEENPLKARKRKENQDPANLSPDMRTMEEQ